MMRIPTLDPRLAGIVLVLLLACEVPVVPRDGTSAAATAIRGSIELSEFGAEPGGDAILFRYGCDAPPPPAGGGRPVDFLLVPEARFEGGQAEFAFSSIPPQTCWLITGFIDRDDNFHYALDVASQPSSGDLGLTSVERSVGPVEDGLDFISPPPSVTLRPTELYEHDRPAFRLGGTSEEHVMEILDVPGETVPLRLDLLATTLVTEALTISTPLFDVIFGSDADDDGSPDDTNGDGLPDIDWPKVLLRRLEPGDPTGQSLAAPPVVLPGVVMALDPAGSPVEYNLLAEASSQGIPLNESGLLETTELRIYVPGLVVTSEDPVELTAIETLVDEGADVSGEYGVLVMNADGRLWTLPNELLLFGVGSQAATVTLVAGD